MATQEQKDAFAIIETGGKQYRVAAGDVITVEKLSAGGAGEQAIFDKVLLVESGGGTEIGAPYLAGRSVSGSVVVSGRAKKVTVIRYKQKSRYFKKRGHRQPFTKVKIEKIS
ncbi:MAG: large subunit ribosomal protein L21 [Parcubacteria group bacterium Gr01-1014_72]|nr:MAG: large subunit ribosomal protein L21 [Parcubacteria group bacterium Gr01-1014_72]